MRATTNLELMWKTKIENNVSNNDKLDLHISQDTDSMMNFNESLHD